MKRSLQFLTVGCLASFLLLGTAACSSVPTSDIKSQAVAAPKFSLGAYKSYNWLGGIAALKDPNHMFAHPDLDPLAETQFLINEQLRSRGLAESAQPELLVAFLLINDIEELRKVEADRAGELPKLVGVGQGALLIELIDAKTQQSVWLGAATAETNTGYTQDVAKARLKYAVENVLANLPK